ncbi:MAG: MFS transporter [Actinomycetota bacterium]|nr:MFS transporter [Actinomycetota bacterium]
MARSTDRRWLAMTVISVGVALVIMDATIVNVAIPLVIRALRLNPSDTEWLNSVYALAFAALLLLFGRLGDLYGRRRMILGGLALFTIASVAAGASASGGMLIGARLAQGIAAAAIMPASLSTVNALFQGRERGIAFAIWGSVIGGMAAVGPVVGGWLATDFSWRWAFWLNIPVGLATMAAGRSLLPETRDSRTRPGLDIGGAVLAALAFSGLVFGLIESQRYGWWLTGSGALSPVPVALAGGIVLLTVFAVVQRRRAAAGKVVLIDLSLLRIGSFRYGSLAALVVAFGEFGLLFTLPLLLQGALGYSALGTGVLVLALAAGTFLISGATPRLTQRLGGRTVVQLGLAFEAGSVAALGVSLGAGVSGWLIAVWLFGYGIGVGMATAQLTSVLLADVPVAQSGEASGVQSTFRQLGSAIGIAVLGGLLVVTLARSTAGNLTAIGLTGSAQGHLVTAVRSSIGAIIPRLTAAPAMAAVGHAASMALIHASKVVSFAAAGVLAAGLILTFRLPSVRPAAHQVPVGAEGAGSTSAVVADPVPDSVPAGPATAGTAATGTAVPGRDGDTGDGSRAQGGS